MSARSEREATATAVRTMRGVEVEFVLPLGRPGPARRPPRAGVGVPTAEGAGDSAGVGSAGVSASPAGVASSGATPPVVRTTDGPGVDIAVSSSSVGAGPPRVRVERRTGVPDFSSLSLPLPFSVFVGDFSGDLDLDLDLPLLPSTNTSSSSPSFFSLSSWSTAARRWREGNMPRSNAPVILGGGCGVRWDVPRGCSVIPRNSMRCRVLYAGLYVGRWEPGPSSSAR